MIPDHDFTDVTREVRPLSGSPSLFISILLYFIMSFATVPPFVFRDTLLRRGPLGVYINDYTELVVVLRR